MCVKQLYLVFLTLKKPYIPRNITLKTTINRFLNKTVFTSLDGEVYTPTITTRTAVNNIVGIAFTVI